MDEVRARYLRDRVLTATPAQRVVMLYDRLGLDLSLAGAAEARADSGEHLTHAMQVIAELQASLDVSAGGPAENLSSIYPYLLNELILIRGGDDTRLGGVQEIVATLRDAWVQAADQVISAAAPSPDTVPRVAGGWVG